MYDSPVMDIIDQTIQVSLLNNSPRILFSDWLNGHLV